METYVRPPRTGMEAFEMMPEGTLCQLINDVLVMSPAPNTSHARVQRRIFSALNDYVEQNKLGEVFFAPFDVYLNKKNVFQPDILFVSAERKNVIERKGIVGAPNLIIEILSEDRNYDLIKKKLVYQETGVSEYWVVDPEKKWCEGFILEEGIYKSLGKGNNQLTIQMFNLPISF